MEQKVGSAYIEIEAKLDKLEGRLTSEIQSIAQKSWQGFTSSFSQALWPLKWAIASVVSVWAFAALSKGIVTLADNLEQAKIAFTTMLWSEKKAVAMLQDLSDFAAKTPFELPEVRQNAKQLLAMGVSAENIIPTLKALGDAAAGTGADMTRLAMNYGQVITQGHLTGRELRDFLVNGIPLLDELAKNAGKSKEEIQNMISSGQISANDVTKAFETMTSEGGKFENLMYKQSATFTGLWSNFQDQLSQMGERIGTGFLPVLKSAVDGLTELVEKNWADIEAVATMVWDTVKVLGEALREVAGELVEARNTASDEVSELLEGITGENEATTTGITGGWSDLFYYLQQGFTAIIGFVSMVLKAVLNIFSSRIEIISNLWGAIAWRWKYALWGLGKWIMSWSDGVADSILWIVNKAIEGLNWMIEKANMLPGVNIGSIDSFKNADSLKSALWELAEEGSEQALDNIISIVKQTIATWDEVTKWVKESSYKMIGNLEKNYVKRIEGIYKKEHEAFEKGLKEKAKAELESLKEREKKGEKLSRDEQERMKRLAEYSKELNTAFTYWDSKTGGWGGGWSSKQSKAQKEALKEIKEAYHDIEKEINTHNKAIEDAQKKVESLNKKYDELKNKARDAFHEAKNAAKELDGQIEELGKDNTKSMIENYQKQQDKLKEMERKNKRIGDIAKLKSLEDWREYKDEKWDINTKIKEIIEYLETQEEIAFLTKHLSSEQLKQAESLSRMTEAEKNYQKYLEKRWELEHKKAAALEKQAIAEAFSKQWEILNSEDIKVFTTEVGEELKARYQDETGKMVEIVDFKNIQYAQDLFNKSETIRLEKEAMEKKISDEKFANEELTMEKMRLDQMYTQAHSKEIDKQKSKVDELIQKYRELARAKASAGARWARAFGWEVKAWLPYLIWENFKPELFVPSTSGSVIPVNNYNQSKSYHFSGITINTNHAEDFWSEIQNHIGDYT